MRRFLPVLLLVLLSAAGLSAADGTVPFVRMEYERLPDLNTPRCGHAIALTSGNEPIVFGGHTTGFNLTATAEYFADGAWHTLDMLYPHDNSFCVQLRSGNILLGGGAAEAFGIGQNWGVESYDPATRTFSSLPILDRKRALANAVELEDGTLLVSGNWYADDAIEACPPDGIFKWAGPVSYNRARPFIFPTSPSDAIIFGELDYHGESIRQGWVDRYRGEAFQVPLLAEWQPVSILDNSLQQDYFIGDAASGDYSSLLLGMREDGAYAFIRVNGETFSLLPLEADIPTIAENCQILFHGMVFVNRASRTGWVFGFSLDNLQRVFLLRVGYGVALDGGKAPLTLFYADIPDPVGINPVITRLPDGSFISTGGSIRDNFNPFSTVYRFLPEGGELLLQARRNRVPGILCLILGCLALCAGAIFFFRRKAIRRIEPESGPDSPSEDVTMAKIVALMEERMLYRQKGLSIADVARALGTNTRYVSTCLNDRWGGSFTDFINGYRVRYAQQLLQGEPRAHLSEIAEEAGFSSESSFFRNFKTITGMTPSQWLSGQ